MRAPRLVGLVMVIVLGFGLAACGTDDGSDTRDSGGSGSGGSASTGGSGSTGDTTTTTEAPDTTEADSGGTATGVDGYCQAVERYIELLGEAIDDPTAAGTELQEAANDYATAALDLGELTPDEQTQFENCQDAAAQAAADLVPGG